MKTLIDKGKLILGGKMSKTKAEGNVTIKDIALMCGVSVSTVSNVLNGKSNCVHVLGLAAVLGVFNSNSFDGSRLVEFYRHPAALLIRGAPFGTVFARSVNSLPCGFAVILCGIAGDGCVETNVRGFRNIAQPFGIAVFIGPIDCEAGAFAANTVCVYGNAKWRQSHNSI